MIHSNDKSNVIMSLELSNDLNALNELHLQIEHFFFEKNIDEKTIYQLKLICDELITNIISYGYADGLHHLISVELTLNNEEWILMITDDGLPFNPLERSDPDLLLDVEDRNVGGLGIYFVIQLVDKIKYERIDEKNILTMQKNFNEEKGHKSGNSTNQS